MKRALVLAVLAGVCAVASAADIPPAPGGQYSDRAHLVSDDSARMIRIRSDFFTRATGCPLYFAALPSAGGADPRDRAGEIFTRWHATEKQVPDESILLVAFAEEKTGALVLGPSVPAEYEQALGDLPPLRWETGAAAGPAIDKLIFDLDARLEAPAVSLKRRRDSFIPPPPRSFLLDGDGRFTDTDRAQIESGLSDLARSSGHPILAVLDPPGLTLALGDFGAPARDRWMETAAAEWRRERPELEDGAILFVFTSQFAGAISYGKNVAGKVPKDVSDDLVKDLVQGQTSGYFEKALVRIADTLDQRFAGKKTLSVRSNWYLLLHPWRLMSGPDEVVPLAFKIFFAALFLYFLGWGLWLVITNPKLVLFQLAGFALGGMIGGVVSKVAGDAAGEVAGKFVGGLGSSGGGGSSGSW